MWQIARVYRLFLDESQIGALLQLDKDVVAVVWFCFQDFLLLLRLFRPLSGLVFHALSRRVE